MPIVWCHWLLLQRAVLQRMQTILVPVLCPRHSCCLLAAGHSSLLKPCKSTNESERAWILLKCKALFPGFELNARPVDNICSWYADNQTALNPIVENGSLSGVNFSFCFLHPSVIGVCLTQLPRPHSLDPSFQQRVQGSCSHAFPWGAGLKRPNCCDKQRSAAVTLLVLLRNEDYTCWNDRASSSLSFACAGIEGDFTPEIILGQNFIQHACAGRFKWTSRRYSGEFIGWGDQHLLLWILIKLAKSQFSCCYNPVVTCRLEGISSSGSEIRPLLMNSGQDRLPFSRKNFNFLQSGDKVPLRKGLAEYAEFVVINLTLFAGWPTFWQWIL